MAKYIDAERLRAEMNSIIESDHPIEYNQMEKHAYNSALYDAINLIDSLQQELPGILKSWKPSAEQMKDLYLATSQLYSVNHPFIKSLYEDLKKLM